MTFQPVETPAPSADAEVPPTPQPSPRSTRIPRRLLALAGLGVVLALLLYYPVGAWRAQVIDDDISFAPQPVAAGQSKAVAVAAALIRREIDVHGWTPNKPFFMPAAILTAMPSYQTGITAMVGRFAIEMADLVGRPAKAEGTSSDVDLDRAAGLMQYPPNVWMIDPAVPWAKTISTEKQYRNGARSFEAYNQRLGAGDASFDRRPEVLQAVAERFAKELDKAAASLEEPIDAASGWFGGASAKAYYGAKGRAYAAWLLLAALGEDYKDVLAERNLAEPWQAMLSSLQAAATPKPWMVMDGDADSVWVPNHLANQGYRLMRARSRLAELAEALR